MFLDRVMYFGRSSGDEVNGRSPKKLKSLVGVPYVPQVKVQILSFNMILLSSPWRVPSTSYSFRRKLRRSGKAAVTANVNIVNCGSYVAHLKVEDLSYNMIFISSP